MTHALLLATALAVIPALDASDSAAAATLTQIVTAAAASVDGTDVLSSRDLQNIVQLEGERQLAGCAEAGACLAEIAGALGARFVVFGQLGRLDDVLVLTLNLFDAQAVKSSARLVKRAPSLALLADAVEPAVVEVIAAAAGEARSEEAVRVLVMDIELAGGDSPTSDSVDGQATAVGPPAVDGEGPSWLVIGGAATAALGVAALVVGGAVGSFALAADERALDKGTRQVELPALLDERDRFALLANVAFVGGAACLALGLSAAAIGLVGDME